MQSPSRDSSVVGVTILAPLTPTLQEPPGEEHMGAGMTQMPPAGHAHSSEGALALGSWDEVPRR